MVTNFKCQLNWIKNQGGKKMMVCLQGYFQSRLPQGEDLPWMRAETLLYTGVLYVIKVGSAAESLNPHLYLFWGHIRKLPSTASRSSHHHEPINLTTSSVIPPLKLCVLKYPLKSCFGHRDEENDGSHGCIFLQIFQKTEIQNQLLK